MILHKRNSNLRKRKITRKRCTCNHHACNHRTCNHRTCNHCTYRTLSPTFSPPNLSSAALTAPQNTRKKICRGVGIALGGIVKTIEATFKVVTPMFMAGADQSQAELRLPSIKGALRFWWRALAWERLRDIKEIRKEENYLFGSADQDVGQAAVLMKLTVLEAEDASQKGFDTRRYPGLPYLGYGVMDYNGKVINNNGERSYIPSMTFQLSLLFKPKVPPQHKETVVDALKLFGLVGGLGAKSRKGYGSVMLVSLEHRGEPWQLPQHLDSLKEALEFFKSRVYDTPQPPYTALSVDSNFVLVEGNRNESALDLLSRIGCEQVLYRSYGYKNRRDYRQPHKVLNGIQAEQNFENDHYLMEGQNVNIRYPRRIAFGLPHNYGQPEHLRVSARGYERRASPLFLHIHEPDRTPPYCSSELVASGLFAR